MSVLRERMIEDMRLHGFSASTQDVYVRAVSQMSEYVHHGPDKVTEEELRYYFLYLANKKKCSRSTIRIRTFTSAVRTHSGTRSNLQTIAARREKTMRIDGRLDGLRQMPEGLSFLG